LLGYDTFQHVISSNDALQWSPTAMHFRAALLFARQGILRPAFERFANGKTTIDSRGASRRGLAQRRVALRGAGAMSGGRAAAAAAFMA